MAVCLKGTGGTEATGDADPIFFFFIWQFAPMVREALRLLGTQMPVVDICDSEMPQFNTDDQRLSDTGTTFLHFFFSWWTFPEAQKTFWNFPFWNFPFTL